MAAEEDATMNDNEDGFDDDGDYEFEEGDEEEEWEEEEVEVTEQEDENIEIDENDMNDADFANLDDEDGFGDDGDGDEWGDDGGDGWGDDGDVNDVQDEINKNPMSTLLNEENTAKKPVPGESKKAINDNIDEVNMLPMFCGVPDLTAPAVMLGIKIKQFKGISRDQLAVWGLSGISY